MEPRLSLKMSQRLVLTPTLQQAIKLLQYSRQELVQYVRQELLENPILEETPPAEAALDEPAKDSTETAGEESAEKEESAGESDLDWSEYLGEYDNGYEPYQAKEFPSYENVLSIDTSLQEHLLQQLNISADGDEEKFIGFEIVGNIDESGYLRAEVEEMARNLGVPVARVEEVLRTVQEFDPPGVAARDLKECLILQLVSLGRKGNLAEIIVRNHLEDLEARRLKKIAREEKVTLEDVSVAARMIAGLEPHPGRAFTRETTQYVIPDINIYKVGDDYHVQLVEEGLPQLRISSFYRRMFRSGQLSATDREFLDKKVNSARWLIKSILQRQQTILKVAKSIVKFQREFLDHGIKSLRPLVLRTVAEDINMHESTVSRVTSKKYAHTPQGILELKFFFNSGIERGEGGSMASVSVRDIIQKIIAEENSEHPLSDLDIVRVLKERYSLDIARRTVAKYRGLLNILPASRRRRMF